MRSKRLSGVAGGLLCTWLVCMQPALAADASPAWAALTPTQQQTLAPLQRDWASIDGNRKQKWLEVAARFPSLPEGERRRVQARMAEWARMTPAERANARLQFQEVRQLPAEERQARWQAYQALSADQRKTLAQRAQPTAKTASAADNVGKPRSTAEIVPGKRNLVITAVSPARPAVAPTVVQAKPGATTTTMAARAAPPSHNQAGLPKIAATPGFVNPATLLPQRGPQGAAVRTAASVDPASQP